MRIKIFRKCIMSRVRNFVFTINNPTEDDNTKANSIWDKASYLIIGKEVGKKGTPHLQGYCELEGQLSVKTIKKKYMPRAHIEKRKGTGQQAADYCKKDGNFTEQGELKKQGKRNDLQSVKTAIEEGSTIREIVETASNYQSIRMAECLMKYKEQQRNWKPQVKWYYGATGTGKTKTAFEECEDPYVAMETAEWWEGYDAHAEVIIDDMRKNFCRFNQLLKLLDRYPQRVEVKGGSRQFLAKKIIITSCYSPYEMYETREDIQQLIRRIDEIKQFDSHESIKKNSSWLEYGAEATSTP